MKNGEIVEVGKHDDLMENKGHYYDMVTHAAPIGNEGKTKVKEVIENVTNYSLHVFKCLLSCSQSIESKYFK